MRLALLALVLSVATPARAQETTSESALPPPPPSVELRPSTVRFRANLEGLRVLYLQDPVLDERDGELVIRPSPAHRYVELCAVPCNRELPQTHLGLAVAREQRVIRLHTPLGVDGPMGVTVRWQSRETERLGGVLLAAIGGVSGLGVGIVSVAATTDDAALGAGVGVGGALLVGAVIVGVLLALMDDDAAFEAAPLPADGDGLFSDQWDG